MKRANQPRRRTGVRDHPWCHAYVWALRLYPRDFRERLGDDMARTFAVRFADVSESERGWLRETRFLTAEFLGLLPGAVRERLRAGSASFAGSSSPPAPRSREIPMSGTLRELRHAMRRLARSPGFTIASIITLALGIGATTAVYSLVHSTVISPLPYPQSDRLVWLDHAAPGIGSEGGLGMTDGLYAHYLERVSSLEDMAIWTHLEVTLAGDEPQRVHAVAATPSLFSALRTGPAVGRAFTDTDAQAGGATGAVLISHRLWVRRFGADPAVVGQTVRANDFPVEIVGVMPAGFEFPNAEVDLWVPLLAGAATTRFGGFDREGIARLVPGASREEAMAEMRAAIPGLADRFGVQDMLDDSRLEPRLPTLKEHTVRDSERALWILLGSVAFVLFLACANVANLLLVRAESRRRETAVRRALGAGPGTIVRYFLAEGFLLSAAGAAAGLLLAAVALRVVIGFGPQHLPRLSEVSIDLPVLLLVLALLVGTTLMFGLVPAMRSGPSLMRTIESGGRATGGPARLRGRNVLVASQVCLALVLLVSTGLMLRSFVHLAALDPGFAAQRVLTFRIGLTQAAYGDRRNAAAFHREILDRISALPGVEEAGATTCLPLCGRWSGTQLTVEGRPDDPNTVPGVVAIRRASEAYFRAVRIPLVAGRLPGRLDQESGTGAAVISRALADSYWPGEDPLGQRFQPGSGGSDWYTVVGIVQNTPITGLSDDPIPMAYLPLVHGSDTYTSPYELAYAVRTTARPQGLLGPIREAIRSLGPDVPLSHVITLEEIVSESNVSTAFTTVVLGVAAGIALLLGVVGIYGVISYMVGSRGKEIAIRMALGARAGQVTWSVLVQGGRVTAVGLALGLAAALVLTRVLDSLLYGVSPTDPFTFATMAALLVIAALVATYIPARRAARVDPARTLRAD